MTYRNHMVATELLSEQKEEIDRLRAENERLRALLLEVERDEQGLCPFCKELVVFDPHADDCRLKAAIGGEWMITNAIVDGFNNVESLKDPRTNPHAWDEKHWEAMMAYLAIGDWGAMAAYTDAKEWVTVMYGPRPGGDDE